MFPSNVFRVGGDEFLVLLGAGASADALKEGEAVVNLVRELNIEYRRIDRPDRERVEVNVVAFALEPEVVRRDFAGKEFGHGLQDALAKLIYPEKVRTGQSCGLVVNALTPLLAPVGL